MAAATTSAPPSDRELAQRILDHSAPSYTFSFSPFLRRTYGHGNSSSRSPCKAFLAGHCPLGSQCPDSHTTAASSSSSSGANTSSYNSLVCKHWLRALCKKGEGCEFLHEYNLRKMPECNFFVRNGYCSNGDECLYLHIDPLSKLPPCPHYERGFCPLGPNCSKRHVRRKLCVCYLAGFCPDGKACKEGAHPRWDKNLDTERPVAKSEVPVPERGGGDEDEDMRDAAFGGRRGDRDDKFGGSAARGDRFGGGRGGRWRGRGDRKFRGRGHH
ncbi:hypothetical protein F5B22DRAFT_627055 [Xylaria bambusicola]|uniref:uncharacterized protein n=1 Tax=Xylaria bambusicola TaxID=326684 RepID=UPI002007A503|nr:uncharacterized protein F5B22DRAFT_627055 [Xylaria bambusicola]KAI0505592.1 hypothetical protein F5B22DRAFT_627055 [Xylaria bambusicola]